MSSKKGLMGGMGFVSVMAASVAGNAGIITSPVQAAETQFKTMETSNVGEPVLSLGTIEGTQMTVAFAGVEMGVSAGLDLQATRFGGMGFSSFE